MEHHVCYASPFMGDPSLGSRHMCGRGTHLPSRARTASGAPTRSCVRGICRKGSFCPKKHSSMRKPTSRANLALGPMDKTEHDPRESGRIFCIRPGAPCECARWIPTGQRRGRLGAYLVRPARSSGNCGLLAFPPRPRQVATLWW